MESKAKQIITGITTVMAVIIMVLISALIINTFLATPLLTNSENTGTITNETLTSVTNVTTTTFGIVSTYPTATCILQDVYNSTSGELLDAGNYTRDSCTIILTDSSTYIGEDVNATYTYASYVNSNAGINSTYIGEQFSLFVVALIGFISVIGVIIAIVWLVMYIKPLFSKKDGVQSFGG